MSGLIVGSNAFLDEPRELLIWKKGSGIAAKKGLAKNDVALMSRMGGDRPRIKAVGIVLEEFQKSEAQKYSKCEANYLSTTDTAAELSASLHNLNVGGESCEVQENTSATYMLTSPSQKRRRLRPNERAAVCPSRNFSVCPYFEVYCPITRSPTTLSSLLNVKAESCSTRMDASMEKILNDSVAMDINTVDLTQISRPHPLNPSALSCQTSLPSNDANTSQSLNSKNLIFNNPVTNASESESSASAKLDTSTGYSIETASAPIDFEDFPKLKKSNSWNIPVTFKSGHPFLSLPQDVLIQIFSFFTSKETILNLQFICHQLYHVLNSDSVWRLLFRRDFTKFTHLNQMDQEIPWRLLYKRCSDWEVTKRYRHEPQGIQNLYIQMETALECLNNQKIEKQQTTHIIEKLLSKSKYSNKCQLNSNLLCQEIQNALNIWTINNPSNRIPVQEGICTENEHDCVKLNCRYEQLTTCLFICPASSTYHICNEKFSCHRAQNIDTDENVFVCPISGRVLKPEKFDWKTLKRRFKSQSPHNDQTNPLNAAFKETFDQILMANRTTAAKSTFTNTDQYAPEDCWTISVPKSQIDTQSDESIPIEEDDWGISGFLGRCYLQGYECSNEIEYIRMKRARYCFDN